MARGVPAGEAERRAVEAMGDAEAVRDELARIHNGWEAVLWGVSRVLLVITLVFFLLGALLPGGGETTSQPSDVYASGGWDVWDAVAESRELTAERQAVFINGYAIWLSGAALRTNETGEVRLCAKVVAQGLLGPNCGWNLRDRMWAEDGNGNQYLPGGEEKTYLPHVQAARRETGYNRVTYEYAVVGFDETAPWIELRFDEGRKPIYFRIELEGQVYEGT